MRAHTMKTPKTPKTPDTKDTKKRYVNAKVKCFEQIFSVIVL